ncbi:MAG: 50S ribosomal protein L17 [Elusimicrobia bacterium]|nr:50S ribosomal protein L17 [Elusimicrobiota bacterium]
MIKNLGYRKLSKTGSHRRAMFANMASSLLINEKIKTTLPKAMDLRRFADHVITSAKKGDWAEVRRSTRNNKTAYNKVFEVIAVRYKDRNGGFTKILRIGPRKGDAAEMVLVKLTE